MEDGTLARQVVRACRGAPGPLEEQSKTHRGHTEHSATLDYLAEKMTSPNPGRLRAIGHFEHPHESTQLPEVLDHQLAFVLCQELTKTRHYDNAV